MTIWNRTALPKLTRNLEQCKRDLSEWGYCLLAESISEDERLRLLERLDEQARLEREQGVAWLGNGGRGGQTWIGYPTDEEPVPVWQGVRTLLNKGRPFIDLIQNDKFAELNGHAFGGMPWYLASTNGIIIRNGAVPMVTHIDQQFVPFETPLPLLNNAMVCLTEFSEANGATRVTPGSHRGPAPKIEVDMKIGDGFNPEPIEQVAAEAPPGTTIMFESRLWHSSGASTSDEARYSISIAYTQSFMRQQDVYPASLHDRVYHGMSQRERELIGFQARPFGRLDPRFPGDRANTDVNNPYIPELAEGLPDRAIAVANSTTINGAAARR